MDRDFGNNRVMASVIAGCVLVIAVGTVFHPLSGFDSLLYDDDKYVFANPVVQEGLTADGAAWAFGFREGTWQPFTWCSHMLDASLFGADPGPMHLHNLVLHVLIGLMIWRVLARATGRPWAGFAVALLFTLHPLQVQSVAWIAERKGLLAALAGLLALDGWTSWARDRDRGGYVRAHVFFALSLMAKPILLPLPVLLLVLDRWPYERAVAWREKLPQFALTLAGGVTAVAAQRSAAALRALEGSGVGARLENAATAWGLTLKRFAAPVDLAGFYPFRDDHELGATLGWAALVSVGSVVAWLLRGRRPAWTTGWTWWLLLQAPAVGFVQFGAQETADRFSYVPLLGLLVIAVYGVDWSGLRERLGRAGGPVVAGLLVVAAVALGAASSRALEPWRGTVRLFEHSIARGGGSAFEHHNLSLAYTRLGNLRAARRHADAALGFAPDDPAVLFQQADLRFATGDLAGAEDHYRRGLAVVPDHAGAWIQVAVTCERLGSWDRAAEAWSRASALNPMDSAIGRRLEEARRVSSGPR